MLLPSWLARKPKTSFSAAVANGTATFGMIDIAGCSFDSSNESLTEY
jgi:hypothetical protein